MSCEQQVSDIEMRKRQLTADLEQYRQQSDALAKQQSDMAAFEAHLRAQASDVVRRQTELTNAEEVCFSLCF